MKKFSEKLTEMRASKDAIEWVGDKTMEEAWETCERGDWMLCGYQKLYPEKIREITLAKGHCANTVRHLMKDERSRTAVDAAIAFGEGKISSEELAAAAYDAADAYPYAIAFATSDTAPARVATEAAAVDAPAYAVAAFAAYATAVDAETETARKANLLETANICRKYLIINK